MCCQPSPGLCLRPAWRAAMCTKGPTQATSWAWRQFLASTAELEGIERENLGKRSNETDHSGGDQWLRFDQKVESGAGHRRANRVSALLLIVNQPAFNLLAVNHVKAPIYDD